MDEFNEEEYQTIFIVDFMKGAKSCIFITVHHVKVI